MSLAYETSTFYEFPPSFFKSFLKTALQVGSAFLETHQEGSS